MTQELALNCRTNILHLLFHLFHQQLDKVDTIITPTGHMRKLRQIEGGEPYPKGFY